jgi:hypothetical protein
MNLGDLIAWHVVAQDVEQLARHDLGPGEELRRADRIKFEQVAHTARVLDKKARCLALDLRLGDGIGRLRQIARRCGTPSDLCGREVAEVAVREEGAVCDLAVLQVEGPRGDSGESASQSRHVDGVLDRGDKRLADERPPDGLSIDGRLGGDLAGRGTPLARPPRAPRDQEGKPHDQSTVHSP